jgi:hypothetical protein
MFYAWALGEAVGTKGDGVSPLLMGCTVGVLAMEE